MCLSEWMREKLSERMEFLAKDNVGPQKEVAQLRGEGRSGSTPPQRWGWWISWCLERMNLERDVGDPEYPILVSKEGVRKRCLVQRGPGWNRLMRCEKVWQQQGWVRRKTGSSNLCVWMTHIWALSSKQSLHRAEKGAKTGTEVSRGVVTELTWLVWMHKYEWGRKKDRPQAYKFRTALGGKYT